MTDEQKRWLVHGMALASALLQKEEEILWSAAILDYADLLLSAWGIDKDEITYEEESQEAVKELTRTLAKPADYL